LERPHARVILGSGRLDGPATQVREAVLLRIPSNPEVMELFVREIEASMAESALALLQDGVGLELVVLTEPKPEQDHHSFLARAEGFHVAPGVFVIRGVPAQCRDPLKRRYRLGKTVERHAGPEHRLELLAITRNRA